MSKKSVYRYLDTGKQNARRSGELCRLLGVSKRDLCKIVEEERRAGFPICSTSEKSKPGYFIAANKGEMEVFCAEMKNRAGEILKTRQACLKMIKRLPDQEGARDNEQET